MRNVVLRPSYEYLRTSGKGPPNVGAPLVLREPQDERKGMPSEFGRAP